MLVKLVKIKLPVEFHKYKVVLESWILSEWLATKYIKSEFVVVSFGGEIRVTVGGMSPFCMISFTAEIKEVEFISLFHVPTARTLLSPSFK